ncbi:hypothetical protein [Enterobacter roggenkampii]|uniref:hypothetical protein n=1 Tax=Enterobacter roggenkampii TaxID=1812935 RepID=UPI003CC91A4C
MFSTPDGVDEENFFYAICHDKNLGFIEHHAPTSSNPFVPPEELEKERPTTTRACSAEEFLAEFVDWSAASLFDVRKWFEGENQDQPVDYPEMCRAVFAVMDTAVRVVQNMTVRLWCVLRRRHPARHSAPHHSRLGCGAD